MGKKGAVKKIGALAVLVLALWAGGRLGEVLGRARAQESAQSRPNARIQQALEALDGAQITRIQLSPAGAQVQGPGASISGNTAVICQGGVYRLSGQMDGQVRVEAGDQDQVILCLDGVELANAGGAALYVDNAGFTVILLEADTENRLQSGTEEDMNAPDEDASGGALYARDDLALAGAGSLWVYGGLNNGIQTAGNLLIDSGSYQVQARNNGLKGKDSVTIAGGSFAIQCGNDAIQSDSDEGEGYGVVSVGGGSFSLESRGDGIQAETLLEISGGAFSVVSGGGSAFASGQGGWEGGDNWDMDAQDLPSTKGFKSGRKLIVSGGDLTVDALDDALHTGGDLLITGGTFSIATGDDGAHADGALTVEGGSLRILRAYEGLEANQVLISGGDIQIVSQDDGINANDGKGETMPNLTITGGSITVDAQGDGLDSNGNLTVEGGILVIDGPTGGGDGALDAGWEVGGFCRIDGGTVLAVGSAPMARTFDEDSGQRSFLYFFQQPIPAGSVIAISDSRGNPLFTHTLAKEAASVVFSSPDLAPGEICYIAAGGQAVQVALDGVSTVAGAG